MSIPHQLCPLGADVDVLHLACASCLLEETLGGCCVDVDDVGLWEWRLQQQNIWSPPKKEPPVMIMILVNWLSSVHGDF